MSRPGTRTATRRRKGGGKRVRKSGRDSPAAYSEPAWRGDGLDGGSLTEVDARPRLRTSPGRPRRGQREARRPGTRSRGALPASPISPFEWTAASANRHGPPSRRSTRFDTEERPMNREPRAETVPQYVGQFDSVGPQPSSEFASAPTPGFGQSTRDQAQRNYISPQASASLGPDPKNPGPEYTLPPTMGKRVLSTWKNTGDVFFSPAKRTPMNEVTSVYARGRRHITTLGSVRSVEPIVLLCPFKAMDVSFMGQQSSLGDSALRPSPPRFKFGLSKRETLPLGERAMTPGPNYTLKSFMGDTSTAVRYQPPANPLPRSKKVNFTSNNKTSMGKQALSTKRSAPSFGFGAATRDQWKGVTMAVGKPRGRGAKSAWGKNDPKFVSALKSVQKRRIDFV